MRRSAHQFLTQCEFRKCVWLKKLVNFWMGEIDMDGDGGLCYCHAGILWKCWCLYQHSFLRSHQPGAIWLTSWCWANYIPSIIDAIEAVLIYSIVCRVFLLKCVWSAWLMVCDWNVQGIIIINYGVNGLSLKCDVVGKCLCQAPCVTFARKTLKYYNI